MESNYHDGTLLGRFLFWYWNDTSVLKHIFKIYVSGVIGGMIVLGSSVPLLIVDYMFAYDSTVLKVIGIGMSLLIIVSVVIQPKILYDIIELVSIVVYYALTLSITALGLYLAYIMVTTQRENILGG